MKTLKQTLATLLIAATVATTASVPQARAGIIFTPALFGIVLLVIGIERHDTVMIVLDADGNLSQSGLEQTLTQKYSFIDNRDVISTLASTIRTKAITTPMIDGKKNVSLARAEVLNILAPTGLAELQPALVDAMIADLQ